jgi:hypothetical protein
MQPIDTASLAQLVAVSTRDVFSTMLGMDVSAGIAMWNARAPIRPKA